MTAIRASREDVLRLLPPNWKGRDLLTTLQVVKNWLCCAFDSYATKPRNDQGSRKLKKANKSNKRPQWLQPNNGASFAAESALAQDQQERTKAILLTKSAML